MAWTAPITWSANTILTAAQLNQQLRDNFLELETAKATGSASLFWAAGANSLVERFGDVDNVTATETTASAAYVDLATVGPTVTTVTGTSALVAIYCRASNNTADTGTPMMSFAISGATTRAALDLSAIEISGIAANCNVRTSSIDFVDGLTAGTNTFTAKYKTITAGTSTFQGRRIIVIPLS